jgi:hypothetical protein
LDYRPKAFARLPKRDPTQEAGKKRLAHLKRTADEHESVNTAKRYKLPERAVEIIKQAAKIHAQQSRAVRIAVEVIWRTPEKNYSAPAAILETPLTGKTYILPPRTVRLIEVLASKFGTRGNVLAACAYLLLDGVKTAEKWGEITPPRQQK